MTLKPLRCEMCYKEIDTDFLVMRIKGFPNPIYVCEKCNQKNPGNKVIMKKMFTLNNIKLTHWD